MIAGDVEIFFGVCIELEFGAMFEGVGEDLVDESDPLFKVFLVGEVPITFLELGIVPFEVLGRHGSGN